jgi:putative Mg2+ transporter-C (MgtC) family protein
MNHLPVWDMILRLVIASALGGLIGLERETHGRPAGLRTHILMCMGSTLFALSSYAVAGTLYDPGRVTAQIVTGIGFLGAGTIMRQGSIVRGLTTAASIWTVAAIGIAVAVGGGMLYVAVAATALVVLALYGIPSVEHQILRYGNERLLTVVVKAEGEPALDVLHLLTKHGVQLRLLGSEESVEEQTRVLRARIRLGADFDESALGADLVANPSVISYSWE